MQLEKTIGKIGTNAFRRVALNDQLLVLVDGLAEKSQLLETGGTVQERLPARTTLILAEPGEPPRARAAPLPEVPSPNFQLKVGFVPDVTLAESWVVSPRAVGLSLVAVRPAIGSIVQ